MISRMITMSPIFVCLNYCVGRYPCHYIVLIWSVVNWCMKMRSRLQASINSWKFCQARELSLFTIFVRKIPSWRRPMPVYDEFCMEHQTPPRLNLDIWIDVWKLGRKNVQ
jgi:hypothetical protein